MNLTGRLGLDLTMLLQATFDECFTLLFDLQLVSFDKAPCVVRASYVRCWPLSGSCWDSSPLLVRYLGHNWLGSAIGSRSADNGYLTVLANIVRTAVI